MKIRDRMILAVLAVVAASSILTMGVWYHASSQMTDQYLKDISESTMQDAYNAFDYMLTDTSYMLTMLSLNEKNIINPVRNLNGLDRRPDGQWNLEYLENKRIIDDYIAGMNGHKYYIVGITIVVDEDCIFDTFHLAQNGGELYEQIGRLDQEALKTKMIMMDPIHAEASKSTVSSDYVVPAVRGILDKKRDVIGYAVLYFDYGVIEQIFAANLPEGSHFQVVNRNGSIIFSNCGEELIDVERPEKGFVYNKFEAEDIGWTFTMALPADFYLDSLQHTTFVTGILMVFIFIAAALLMAFLISRITSEITNLQDSMYQVSAGKLDVVYEVHGKDEIAQMGETFNHMVSRIDMLMKKVAQEEREKRLVEISFLEAQINPHFVSNILNNVTWMAKMQHADNIVPLVQSLNSMLQNVMHQEEDMILLKNVAFERENQGTAELSTLNEFFELLREDIMDFMNREKVAAEKARYRYSPLVNQVIEFVGKNYREDISLEACAMEFGSSYTHLSRAFKQETGMRFVEYLNEQRVNRAKSLLIRGELPMKEIVEQAGFRNYNYFFKVFKESTGMKPSEFAAKI